MTGADFLAWRHKMKLTQGQAAKALDVHRGTISLWESDDNKTLPVTLALACAALARGLGPWGHKSRQRRT